MKKEKKQKVVQRTSKKIEESLTYTVEVRDKEGRIIQRISAPSRSFVQQWNQVVNIQTSNAPKTVKDVAGVSIARSMNLYNLGANPGIGNDSFGIRVGKGTTAVAIDDYALESPLVEGTGADEFNHQQVQFTEPSVVGSSCSFTVKRVMINNSGATISDIKEISCYIQMGLAANLSYALGWRDVLPSAVYVPDGGAITVTYTIGVTV